ncbi:hypothetical protein ACPOL_5194 [Acidisarcina polymorpha]|uniref:Uncharacterized protein n=1 Tax=Acidisarcina polymorpha TaxID=2211140 RepID=A0A2Z5G5S6_9BACT|nr:hypothetical protein ACPOL_5194 [Acidisarcina polymorpha]
MLSDFGLRMTGVVERGFGLSGASGAGVLARRLARDFLEG